MLDREATIGLNMIPGIGHVKYTALCEAFGSPAGVPGRSAEELREVPGIGPQLAERVAACDWGALLGNELELCDRAGVRIVTLWDEAYPEVLRSLYDPPLCLYVRGKLPPLPENAVAVVGTRRMTQYGARMTRMITEEAVAAGVKKVSLDEAFHDNEIIILAGGSNSDTFHMVGAEQFAAMQEDALFVNIARGKMVDQSAMIEAAKTKRIFLALDVFENEPLESDSPLRTMERVLLTPHRANNSIEFEQRWNCLADEIERFAAGKRPESALTVERAAAMSES